MRRSNWARGLRSHGLRAAVEEPRPASQVSVSMRQAGDTAQNEANSKKFYQTTKHLSVEIAQIFNV